MKISILDDYHDTLPSRQIYGTFSLSVTSRSVRGRVVGKLHIGITSGLPVIRPEPSRRVRDHLHFATFRRYPLLPVVVVLYCARHRFSTDAMEGTGNLMAVMGCDGASISPYHAHLQPLERDPD